VKVCLLIPVYNHPHRIGALLYDLARFALPCVLVDDGSDVQTRGVLDHLAAELPWVHIERRAENGGRGVAMQTGYRCARRLGYTHALQLDADGQHSPDDVPALLAAARAHPDAMILAAPQFDASAPASRLLGRQISRFWVWVETLGFAIDDPLCGMRLLPLLPVCRVIDRGCGTKMEFDPELAVRLYWDGVPVVNVPAVVRYFDDGISHFRPLRDNVRMSWLHTRLVLALPYHVPSMLSRRLTGGARDAWHARKERGSELGIRIIVWLYRAGGERIARAVVALVVAYFLATDAAGRRASRAYLSRVARASRDPGGAALATTKIPDPPRLRHVYRHYHAFGMSILDRAALWLGRRGTFSLDIHGGKELDRVVEGGRGAVLLGAHLGSFDVMRLYAASDSPIDIHVMMYTAHAPRINRVFERLDRRSGASGVRVHAVPIEPGAFHHALRARELVRAGHVVALLADRMPPGAPPRTCTVTFLGERVRLPRSPFALAHALACPVLVMAGLCTGRRRYEIRIAQLSPVRDPRVPREIAIDRLAQQYAGWLEPGCLRAPYQWFNFFDVFAKDAPDAR
jgi:predicted LPLAT superfamily acyltransferase